MTDEKNRRHKRNRNKKRMEFENTKASFVSGIVVLITVLNDTVGLLANIPFWIELMEVLICLLLFYLALGTTKMDKLLNKTGVEQFGSFLTVYSILIILLEKLLLRAASEEMLSISVLNDKLFTFIVFLALSITGIYGAIYLLVYKYPKNK